MFLISLLLSAQTPTQPPGWLQQAIKSYFETELFDARSARWLWVEPKGEGGAYCGWVNARNRFGAYAGYLPYYVIYEGRRITGGYVITPGNSRVVLEVICESQGYNVSEPPRP